MSEEPGEYRIKKQIRLNGWQRLWVVLSILWSPAWMGFIGYVIIYPAEYPGRAGEVILIGFGIWLGPIVALYALGSAIGWVRRGF